ncbi:type II secretion system protein GspM [Xylophilus sp. ASV27]|uniref:type II secretion system protein GspM n=1 Tax=Xylophilus sp. ASV27 TaxID=2795129 RepID=UPI0018EE4648|nr:type II secretion system protein GspM [Xylophilus sp. ASV27]
MNPQAAALRARWRALAPRERSLVRIAALALGAALLWWVLLAPALRTLQAAELRRGALDAQEQRLLVLKAEAERLKSQPRASHDESLRALEASVRDGLAGTGRLSVVGERATVTLRGTPAETLAAWLDQARANARALPQEARLARSTATPAQPARPPAGGAGFSPVPPAASAPAAADDAVARWDGTVVLALPPR